MASVPEDRDALYVGYLPLPRRHARMLRILVPLMLWVLAAGAFVLSRSQPDPGAGVWDDGRLRTFMGTVRARPYPMLEAEDRGDGTPGTLLIVEVGKFAGGARAAPFDGRRAIVKGWLLQRNGQYMIELEPGDGAVTEGIGTPEPEAPVRSLGSVTLRGEIVDTKCYLGAMKPGHGKPHKECATLCVVGGIPPTFVVRGEGAEGAQYLLVGGDGGPLDPAAHRYIADPVEIRGELEEANGLRRVRVSPENIRRR